MNPVDLSRVFRPRHIAVFGGDWAANVVEQCQKLGYSGAVWPVHPWKTEVNGLKCYNSLDELPLPPDVSFVGVDRERTLAIIADLSTRGAGGAVCFASGFAEAGLEDRRGVDLQKQLREVAAGMPVIGPNCYGFLNLVDRVPVWPDQHGCIPCDSGVAIISQSGNIAVNISMQSRGLPLAYLVTVGNQASVCLATIAMDLIKDSRVTAIGLHIEGFGGLDEFQQMASLARELAKPIVAIKAGRSAEASEATISHTGALAGNDSGADALLKRLGIARVYSVPVFLESLKLLHTGGPLGGRRIGSLSCSGGEACLIADATVNTQLRFDKLTECQASALRTELGPMVHLANPLDYHLYGWGDEDALTGVFSAMLTGDYDLTFLVIDFPRRDRCSDEAWIPAIRAISNASDATGARVAVVACLPENLPEHWARSLIDKGIAPLHGIDDALAATEVAAFIGDCFRKPAPPKLLVCGAGAGHERTILEHESKQILKSHGIAVPEGIVAGDMNEVEAAADRIGFPTTLKGIGFPHKSEHGAIALNLTDREKLLHALSQMPSENGHLVERFIPGAIAELLIGVTRDSCHGFLLTLGAGGTFTELFSDTRHLLLPTNAAEIEVALRGLRIWPILEGYRGSRGADIGAIVKTALAVAEYAAENADILVEIEINPFLAMNAGGFAADALIRFG